MCTIDAESARLAEVREQKAAWKKWGPYLTERQWGTVREDTSESGDAWNSFTHDQARSRASIAVSKVGKVSGAHINPAISVGFMLMGKLRPRATLGYIIAQLCGAVLGSFPLLAWGAMGRSVNFGATVPGPGYSTSTVLSARS